MRTEHLDVEDRNAYTLRHTCYAPHLIFHPAIAAEDIMPTQIDAEKRLVSFGCSGQSRSNRSSA